MNKYIAQLLLKLLADKESRNRILTAVLSIAAGLLFLMAAPVIVLSSMKEMGAPSISFDETKLPSEISDRLDETEAEIKAIEDALTVIGLREQTVKAQLYYRAVETANPDWLSASMTDEDQEGHRGLRGEPRV